MKDIDLAVEAYCESLRAESEFAERDIEELEDHLRELAHDLRTQGLPGAEAVTEAARRLGHPRALAAEHGRVRPTFGLPLSWGRAISAAFLFALSPIALCINNDLSDNSALVWFDLLTLLVVTIAVGARAPWARSVALGITAGAIVYSFVIDVPPSLELLIHAGVLAFLLPWRRNEVSMAGIGLALQTWGYGSASSLLALAVVPGGGSFVSACGALALVSSVAGCVGSLLRSRWSAIASAITAVTLSIAMTQLQLASGRAPSTYLFGAVGCGAVASAVAAILCWRINRSFIGKLREPVAVKRWSVF